MTQVAEFPDLARLRSEAAAWVAKLDAGHLTAADLAALRAWVNRSDRHRDALDQAASQWDDLNVLALYRSAMVAPRRRFLAVAIAASVAAFAIAWGLIGIGETDQAKSLLAANGSYVTVVGEQRLIALPDGSAVRLNTNSRLEIGYSTTQRGLHLVKGEAFFDVAKNANLPFVVTAGSGEVIAVGTAFAIRVDPTNEVHVTVSEGRVRIRDAPMPRQNDPPTRPPLHRDVVAGQVAVFDATVVESIRRLDTSEVERRLAWRNGMLVFNGDPLESVVSEVSRYTDLKIVISDPALRSLKVGGYFPTGDTDALLHTLASDFEITAERVAPDLVYLRARTL